MPDKQPGFGRIVDKPAAEGWNQDAFEAQLGLVLERVDDVAQAALTPKQVADAVRDGITAALADPAVKVYIRGTNEHHP